MVDSGFGNPKERDSNDLRKMWDIDRDKLGHGKLEVIDTSKWSNQSISMTQAISILKEQQIVSIDNFTKQRKFLDKLKTMFLAFIKTNDVEVIRAAVGRDMDKKIG